MPYSFQELNTCNLNWKQFSCKVEVLSRLSRMWLWNLATQFNPLELCGLFHIGPCMLRLGNANINEVLNKLSRNCPLIRIHINENCQTAFDMFWINSLSMILELMSQSSILSVALKSPMLLHKYW